MSNNFDDDDGGGCFAIFGHLLCLSNLARYLIRDQQKITEFTSFNTLFRCDGDDFGDQNDDDKQNESTSPCNIVSRWKYSSNDQKII